MKKKINKNKGILFWVTGLSGSGKTVIAEKIKNDIIKYYGPTLLVSGDDLRKIFKFNKYTASERKVLGKYYCDYAKFITNQKINLIFAVVAMQDSMRHWNKKNIDNYLEVYIKTKIKTIIKANKKKIYHKKNSGDIVGINIKPELPKKSDIIINNNFKKSTDILSQELISKIKTII
jgi:adenylylsulfate kinase-like enzyme